MLATGWVGVQLFFVLSGFLITGILYDTLGTPHFFRNFYARRALRIFPLYYLFIGGLFLISRLQGWHWQGKGTLLYLTYLHTLVLGPVGYTNAPWVNLNHLWSLAIEEQFYLIWPLSVFLLRTPRRIFTGAVVVSMAVLLLRCWLEWSGVTKSWGYAIYSWSPSQFDSLLIGGALAMLVRSRVRAAVLRISPWMFGFGLLLVLVYEALRGAPAPLTSPLVATAGFTVLAITFAALIGTALQQGGAAERLFSAGWLRALGRYSYGLYVYHFLIHQLLTERLHAAISTHVHSKILPLLGSGAVTLAVSLVVAAASFHFIEQPILRLKRYFPAAGGRPRLRQEAELASVQAR